MLGVIVGTAVGIYVDQTYETPDVKSAAVGLLAKVLRGIFASSVDIGYPFITRRSKPR